MYVLGLAALVESRKDVSTRNKIQSRVTKAKARGKGSSTWTVQGVVGGNERERERERGSPWTR